jgi:predicted RNase H-like HicB family nuclease
MTREFYVVIEQDEDGMFIGEVPQLRSCYTQAKSVDELMVRIREVIELCLESEGEFFDEQERKIIEIKKVAV